MVDFLNKWQTLPYRLDPVAFNIADFQVHYYGLSYTLGFMITYVLVNYRVTNELQFIAYKKHLQKLMIVGIIGIIFGGRIGYVFIYDFDYFIRRPLEIILPINLSDGFVFTGFRGMSYHGALIGSIFATFIYTKLHNLDFLKTIDLFIPVVSLGYTFGRIGNFINGELYGRPTTLQFGMYFPDTCGDILRHPSQLYEAFLEGLLIFIILWNLKNKIHVRGLMLGLYLILYGVIRFFIEYLRQPDFHIGLIFFSLSMGQILCIIMLIIGFLMILYLSQ